jgi:hypothetical protein
MSRIPTPALVTGITGVVLIATILVPLAVRGGRPEPAALPAAGGPVLVELFTSQGCSSCPPADRLLSQLGKDPRLAGRVIPLAFHVDYWDHIGWRDPFSSARWSQRQQAYARAFHSQRIYTPQLVVAGKSECVGSNEGEVRKQIAEAMTAMAAQPAGTVTVEPGRPEGGKLHVRVSAKLARAAGPAGDHGPELWVALYQRGLSTPVKAGENASRTLEDDYVVRRLERAAALESSDIVLDVDPSWPVRDLGVVAFLQDPRTLAIQGVAAKPLGVSAP